jgi:hypothetical protein
MQAPVGKLLENANACQRAQQTIHGVGVGANLSR